MDSTYIGRLVDVYNAASAVRTGKYYTTVNELTDQVPATRPDTLRAAIAALVDGGPPLGNKLLCEEDKGGILGAGVSLELDLPLAMARWYPYVLPNGVAASIKMEYFSGTLYVNGVAPGDELVVVDDTLSTGGTIVALADAVARIGARVVEIRVVVEKLGNGGRERIRQALGLSVSSAIGISVGSTGEVRVIEVQGRPLASADRPGRGRKLA